MDTITLDQLAEVLEYLDVEPSDEYSADSGRDYGHVVAYDLGRLGYLIAYGNNGQTNYALVEEPEDLPAWLIDQDLAGWDHILELASVRGLEAVVEALEDEDYESCRVLVSSDYYDCTTKHCWARGEDGEELDFATYEEAAAWVEEEESERYVCEHNEIGRPTYTIVGC